MTSTTSTKLTSTLLQTIEADLSAGLSWFESEAEMIGLMIWNTLKSAFIALEPQEGQILMDILTLAVSQSTAGMSIEQIETSALTLASTEQKAVLLKSGTGIIQTIIAGLRANQPSSV